MGGWVSRLKDVVRRSVVLPFTRPELYCEAVAKSCGAAFIEVRVEALFGKWLGHPPRRQRHHGSLE
eukprot:gene24586-47950_t